MSASVKLEAGIKTNQQISILLPLVLWHCWFGTRKSVGPVKSGMLARLSVWREVQLLLLPPHHLLLH